MVFKVLSEEEIALLNEEQKVRYEEEHSVYQQRVNFVNRLEELEDVNVEQYNMEISSIDIIPEREIHQYKNPELSIKSTTPVKKPNLQVVSFKSLSQNKPIIPIIVSKPVVKVVYFHQKETKPREMPIITKPVANSKNFNEVKLGHPNLAIINKIRLSPIKHKPITNNHPNLPIIIKPSINLDIDMENLVSSSHVNTNNLPRVLKTNIPINKVKMILDTQLNLSEIQKANIPVQKVNMIIDAQPSLPEMQKAKIPDHKVKIILDTQPNLPKMEKVNIPRKNASIIMTTELNLLDIQVSSVKLNINLNTEKLEESSKVAPENLPMVLKISAPVQSVLMQKSISTSLPNVSKTSIPEYLVTIPTTKAELPDLRELIEVRNDRRPMGEIKPTKNVKLTTIVKPDVNVREFKMNSLPSINLPKQFRPNINIKEYKESKSSKIEVKKVPEMNIPKSTYAKDVTIDKLRIQKPREVAIKLKDFNLSEIPKPNMPTVITPIPSIKEHLNNGFDSQENQVALVKDYSLNSIMKDSIKIPDASVVLQELLYELGRETEDLKGL